MSTVAVRVKERRQSQGLTPEQLGVAAGISSKTIYNVEAGQGCRMETLVAIAKALGVTAAYLLGEQEEAAV